MPGRRFLAFTAVTGARCAYAWVEGLAFIFTKEAVALVGAAEVAAFVMSKGARLPLRVAASTLLAASSVQGLVRLVIGLRHSGGEGVSSVWDWEPPTGNDGAKTGAWHILRQIVLTVSKVRDANPAIAKLLDRAELAPSELGKRLYYFYCSSDKRLLMDGVDLTNDSWQRSSSGGSAAPGSGDEAASGDEQAAARSGSADEQGASNSNSGDAGAGLEPVPEELMEQLRQYRPFACLPYEQETDVGLAHALKERGFALVSASHAVDMTSGCPAFFLTISEERQEVMLVVRGTFTVEDAFLDMLATGESFGEAEEEEDDDDCGSSMASEAAEDGEQEESRRLSGHCHSGMGRGAMFLAGKFGAVLQLLAEQGLRVTLVGHSLGAGIAAMLAIHLKNRGMSADSLRCWAYESPACMDKGLAEGCADVVCSLVHADDVVPRLNIRSFAGLLEELAAFDWQAAKEELAAAEAGGEDTEGNAITQHLAPLLGWALNDTKGKGREKERREKEDKQKKKQEEGKRGKEGTENGAGSGTASGAGSSHGSDFDLKEEEEDEEEQQDGDSSSDGFDEPYNAHVPGKVVLLYRKTTATDAEHAQCDGRALVPCTHPTIRRMRLSSRMISDHFVDTPEFLRALES